MPSLKGTNSREPISGAAEKELTRLVTALLKAPPHELDLPPRLMRLYLQSRWISRRELICAWLIGLAVVNALVGAFDPFIANTPEGLAFFVGRICLSALMVASAAALKTMENCGREGFLVVSTVASLVVMAGLGGLLVDVEFMKHAFAQAMFAGAATIVVARISWADTVLLAWTLMILLLAVMALAPMVGIAERGQTVMLFGTAIIGLTWMRKVQNRFLYRVFLEGLQERLKSEEIRDANGRLAVMARTDPLTSLPNRRHCDEALAALDADAGIRKSAALFMIDIDYFKRLNDDRGHAHGDDCLRVVAGVIRRELRDGRDFAGRFGGEEFMAVLRDVSESEAHAVADRLRAAVADRRLPHPLSPFGVVTVSVGVALSPPTDAEVLLTEADAALYEAKALGRNRVRCSWSGRAAQVA